MDIDMKIPHPDNFIFVNSWPEIVGKADVSVGLTEELAGLDWRKPVLTYGSDYSICYQQFNNPNVDLIKMAAATDFYQFCKNTDNYHGFSIGPCATELCRTSDTFSVKTDRFTWFTLRDLPERFFSTNLDVCEPGAKLIPYGLNPDGDGYKDLIYNMGTPKTKLLYINFSPTSYLRFIMLDWIKSLQFATVQSNVSVSDYMREMAKHKFVLCPTGNGIDSYRLYEAWYLGCIPVLILGGSSSFGHFFSANIRYVGLPLLVVYLHELNKLEKILSTWVDYEFNYEWITKSYWSNFFEN